MTSHERDVLVSRTAVVLVDTAVRFDMGRGDRTVKGKPLSLQEAFEARLHSMVAELLGAATSDGGKP